MSLAEAARAINQSLARKSKMEVGAIIMHPDGYLVKIKSGYFLDPIYGRVSNHWHWNKVNADGSLGEAGHGYGW